MSAVEAMQALLLDKSVPTATEADSEDIRRLKLASHVYDAWTAGGANIAQLADRFMDGSLDALSALTGSRADGAPAAAPSDVANSDAKPSGIAVHHASDLSYEEFVVHYMAPNVPVIIQGVTDGWAAQGEWVLPNGGVNTDFLARSFGDSNVMATDTSRQADGCGVRRDMPLSEYLTWWRQRQADDAGSNRSSSLVKPPRQSATAASEAGASSSGCDHSGGPGVSSMTSGTCSGGQQAAPLLYLKDWHFASEHPHYQAYTTPPFFQDDWLNDYYDAKSAVASDAAAGASGVHSLHQPAAARCLQRRGSDGTVCAAGDACGAAGATPDTAAGRTGDVAASCIATSDYRFVYLGPKGSWTPLHADVLRSFSWSVNVAGAKRWLLLPPRHTHLLYDRFGRCMAPSFSVGPGSEEQYPNLAEARRHVLEVLQGTSDAIFVPSGWHHTVENLQETLSTNHNWLNGWNLHWGLRLLQREHTEAAAAIEDCREGCTPAEFEGLVQRNVAANAGLGFAGLADLVTTIARRELRRLAGLGQQPGAGVVSPGQRDRPASAECQHCVAADAAASAAESLAAGLSTRTGSGAEAQVSELELQQLQCLFNLRRGLFVLEALEAHDRSVLGSSHDAEASSFASELRHIRIVLDRFDQTKVGL